MENIRLDCNINIRDLGGLKSNGITVKNKLFIRSASLEKLSSNDIDILKNEYNLKTIIDLRNNYEIVECRDVLIDGVKYINIPILSDRVEGITRNNKVKMDKVPNMCELYLQMVSSDNSSVRIRKILKTIMKRGNKAILFHCSYGKDRTGIIALLLLSMLGIDYETIMKDYLYTNVLAQDEYDRSYEYLLSKTHNEDYAGEYSEIHLAKEDYLNAAYQYMVEEYGSVLNYIIKGLGISKRKIEKFRMECVIEENL